MMYSKKVLEHFRNPKNMGKIKKPDGYARVGNPQCGDIMQLYIKVEKRSISNKKMATQKTQKAIEDTERYIKDIKFQTLGCAAAISTSSVLTEMVKGKSLEEAEKVKSQDVIKALGGLPNFKLHCSLLIVKALKKAIGDYKSTRLRS